MISLKTRGAGFVTCPRSEQWGTDLAHLAGKENGWVHRSRSHFDGARTFLCAAALRNGKPGLPFLPCCGQECPRSGFKRRMAGFMDGDLAPPVRAGGILAVFPSPRPLKRGRHTPARAVSSPLKGLRGRLDRRLVALYWLGRRQLVAQRAYQHPLGIRCACR
jgi:hypothetical protein